MSRKQLILSVNESDLENLKWICDKSGMSKSEVVRQLMKNAIANPTIVEIITRISYEEYVEKLLKKHPTTHNALSVNYPIMLNKERFKDGYWWRGKFHKYQDEAHTVDQDQIQDIIEKAKAKFKEENQ